MKILLVSPLPPPMGGIATLTKRMIDNMSSSEMIFDCVNVAHKVKGDKNTITKYSRIEPVIIMCRAVLLVLKKCRQKQCNIIHINSSSGGGSLRDYIIERIAKHFNIPVLIQYHCNLKDATERSKIAKRLYKRCFSLAKQIIVLNRYSQEFVKKNGFDSIIVPNGISSNLIASKHHISESIKTVFFSGRVSEAKGCLEIYECAKAYPQIKFDLAGLIDDAIRDKMSSLGNINLMGVLSREEIIHELDKSDVFIFPSHSEGFSVSLLEAMARGVPCIASNVGANQDMLENKGGIIIPTRDFKATINAMKSASESEVRSSMSTWNINKTKECYTEESVFKFFQHLYDLCMK